MKIEHISFVVPGYPTKDDPQFTFVAETIRAIADQGIVCTVFTTQSISKSLFRGIKSRPSHWIDETKNGHRISIHQPKVISVSNVRLFGWSLSSLIAKQAIFKTFKKVSPKTDILYAHFWHSGVIAGEIANKYNIPLVVATGESKIWAKRLYPEKVIHNNLRKLVGLISVSTKNLNESRQLGLCDDVPNIILPNAIETSKFFPRDKWKMSQKYGFPQKAFIISFVGAFIERKGPLRLQEAVKRLGDSSIKVIYIGDGPQKPHGDEVLHAGRVPHDVVPEYLACSDIFVLPTLAEGCSNAIVEAMACGLPVVSSNLSFNEDILDESNSILVDPMNVQEIADAISYLRGNGCVLEAFGNNSQKKARDLSITNRVSKIIEFLEQSVFKMFEDCFEENRNRGLLKSSR